MQAMAALSSPVLLVLLLAAVHPCCVAVSLMQRIRESDNLTVFSQLLTDTGLDRQLNSNASCAGAPCFLVFAPTDEAFARSAGDVAELLASADSRLRLANQHIVVTAINNGKKILLSSWPDLERPPRIGRDVGLGQARLFSASSSSVLFWQAKLTQDSSWSYHANNARINAALSNQEAANGVYHMLDDVALPLGRDLPLLALVNSAAENALVRRMSIGRTLSIFKDWMARDIAFQFLYNALLGGGGGFNVRTVFLPTDAAWEALPPAAWQRLNASADAFRSVLTAHIAANVSLFTGWLPAPPQQQDSDSAVVGIDFVAGHAESKSRLAGRLLRLPQQQPQTSHRSTAAFAVVVGGVVASVGSGANLPLRDAVVHTVDRVLAFPGHRGLADAAERLAPGFRNLCRRFDACERQLTTTTTTKSDAACTLFAPVDVAGLLRASENASAARAVEQILLLHFVPNASIASYNMTHSLLVSGGAGAGQIRFRWSRDSSKLLVEGRLPGSGFVQSELLTRDEPTESGCLLHTIARPLAALHPATAAAVQLPSLGQLIGRLPQLSAAAAHLDAGDFKPALGSGSDFNGTAFVPDNTVMTQLESFLQQLQLQLAAANTGVNSSNNNSSNVSLSAVSVDELRAEALRSLLIPSESFVADDAATGENFTYRTAASIGNGGGSATVLSLTVSAAGDGSADRIVQLQTDSVVAQAMVSSGQYQCTNGILYTLESAAFHQRRRGGGGGSGSQQSGMLVDNDAAVAMATAKTTLLVVVASATALLQLLV